MFGDGILLTVGGNNQNLAGDFKKIKDLSDWCMDYKNCPEIKLYLPVISYNGNETDIAPGVTQIRLMVKDTYDLLDQRPIYKHYSNLNRPILGFVNRENKGYRLKFVNKFSELKIFEVQGSYR